MNIIVLIKQVPNTTEVKIDPKTGNLIREGVEAIINPEDTHALEAGLSLRERYGGLVTAITMGPPQAIDALTEALGMGVDKAILLTDKAFAGADTWATSTVLGRAISALRSYDIIICGRQAIDGDTAQIGPQVAEYLNIPQATYVFDIEGIEDGYLTVKRRIEEGYQRVRIPLPCLITVVSALNKPRFANVGLLLNACRERSPIQVLNAADLGLKVMEVGLTGSLTQVIRTFSPKGKREPEMLSGDVKTQVQGLLARFREKKIISWG